ncbi:MAG: hypothetical protein ACYS32_01750 [Planctomycetota bacterium]
MFNCIVLGTILVRCTTAGFAMLHLLGYRENVEQQITIRIAERRADELGKY